ncbi:MAG TPA: hypothetical protein VGM49_07880, partial [Candidatus Limnocylindrales bacterium]
MTSAARRAGPGLRPHAGLESVAHDIDQDISPIGVADVDLCVERPQTPPVPDDDSGLVERNNLGGGGEDPITALPDPTVDLRGMGRRGLCRGASADANEQHDENEEPSGR